MQIIQWSCFSFSFFKAYYYYLIITLSSFHACTDYNDLPFLCSYHSSHSLGLHIERLMFSLKEIRIQEKLPPLSNQLLMFQCWTQNNKQSIGKQWRFICIDFRTVKSIKHWSDVLIVNRLFLLRQSALYCRLQIRM